MDNRELLETAIDILKVDLTHLAAQAAKGALTGTQNRSLNDSIRTLVIAVRSLNDQEEIAENSLKKMSDTDLAAKAKEVLDKLTKSKEKDNDTRD